MKTLFLFIATFIFQSSFSQSDTTVVRYTNPNPELEFVTTFKTGENVYILLEQQDYEVFKLWVKFEMPVKYIKNKKGKKIKSGGGFDMIHIVLNCEKREYDLEKAIKYDSNGKVKTSTNVPQNQVSIIPDSLFDYVRKHLCH